jgi:hypothetical protein
MIGWFTPPTSNVLDRVFLIKGTRIGTSFLVDRNNKQYLLTAAHNISDICDKILIYLDDDWRDLGLEYVHVSVARDVAVLRFPKAHIRHSVELSDAGIVFGQHVFFLGFPYAEAAHLAILGEGRLPVPFVKWGSISMMPGVRFSSGAHPENRDRLILQGVANSGFSGGPVVFNRAGTQRFCGMIIKSRQENMIAGSFDGSIEKGFEYSIATEFSLACSAQELCKIIDQHPLGAPIPSSDNVPVAGLDHPEG